MIEREFEDYLALLRGLLRLRKTQCDAISDELRDHMDARLEDLLAEGIPREKAVQIALEEFGDAAGVGQAFLELNRNNQRRWNMKVTAASLISCTALGLAAMAFWPDSAPQVSNPVMAQAGGAGLGGPGGMPGMPPQQHVRTREENNAITAEILSRVSQEGIQFENAPLTDVVNEIRDKTLTGFNVIFDKQKLEEANIDLHSPITLTLTRGVRHDTMLELMLNSVSAGYYIHDGIVIVTSKEALAAVTEVRVYNVADLVYLDTRWPLDPHQGGPSGSGAPGMYPGGMGPSIGAPGMGHPGGMGPGGMGPGGGGKTGGPPGGFGGPPGGIGGVGGPPGGIGGMGGGPPPGGIGGVGGGPPPGGKGGVGGPQGGATGKGGPGAGGGIPGGGVPGSGGVPGGPPGVGVPGSPGAPGGSGAGVSAPDGVSGSAEGASGIGSLESILTSPVQFLAQMGGAGMGMGGPGGMAGGTGAGGEGGGMMGGGMAGMGGGYPPPKYFSKNPEQYTPEERRTVDLIDAIIASVEPESWMATGDGIGEIRPFEGLIVIRNTPKAHQGVEQLLEQIRAARHMQQGGMGGAGGMGAMGGGFFSIDGK